MPVVLFDTTDRKQFYPFCLTRAIADFRSGILTIKERWERLTGQQVYVLTEPFLQPLYEPLPLGEHLLVDARVIPDEKLVADIFALSLGQAIVDTIGVVAGKAALLTPELLENTLGSFTHATSCEGVRRLLYTHELMLLNEELLRFDFQLLSHERESEIPSASVAIIKPEAVFIETGAVLEHCILNASTGPIYIGRNTTVMEGSCIRGPFALCEGGVVKMGSTFYGATTIGPYSAAGGEIKNSILTGYCNKSHHGYLGDSVIGEWCNLGAGTSNSNLKNTVGEIKLWNPLTAQKINGGRKCGVLMGDYTRTAINTSLNTGTVAGICSNIFTAGLSPTFIPDFSWGDQGAKSYWLDKALDDVNSWKMLKNKSLSSKEAQVLKHIFDAL